MILIRNKFVCLTLEHDQAFTGAGMHTLESNLFNVHLSSDGVYLKLTDLI